MKKKKSKIKLGSNEKVALKSILGVSVGQAVLIAGTPTGIAALIGSAPVWLPVAAVSASVLAVYSIGKVMDKDNQK